MPLRPFEVHAVYVYKERCRALTANSHEPPYFFDVAVHRYATFEEQVMVTSDAESPVALRVEWRGAPLEYRWHGGRLYRNRGDRLRVRGGRLVMRFDPHGNEWGQREETPEDIAAAGPVRDASIAAARSWASTALIVMEFERRQVSCLRREDEPLLVVIPPGEAKRSTLVSASKVNKLPGIKVILRPGGVELSDDFLAALREDRLFRIDETEDAQARAMEFGERIHRGRERFELRDPSCLLTDLSAMAMRLTGLEAIAGLGGQVLAPEVETARAALLSVVDDAVANAAAMCPPTRSLLASFRSSREALRLSQDEAVAPLLDRLQRAHDRAQKRMAACRIPDHDPRAMAPEDDIAIGRLAP